MLLEIKQPLLSVMFPRILFAFLSENGSGTYSVCQLDVSKPQGFFTSSLPSIADVKIADADEIQYPQRQGVLSGKGHTFLEKEGLA
ncbi:hypothetical protein [Ktedonobacter racemifer]|uniref:hypothetical protein n=1 Tax=Ktedonobacter racemifer TaxID=363277 RepID=UPI0012F78FB7|nr:hypothetical protein [Ktedonobacter racemifer]